MIQSLVRRCGTLEGLEPRVLLTGEPLITGTVAGQGVDDNATIFPFASVVITDDDPALHIEVALDNSIRGVFTPASLAASSFTDAGSGRYTFVGSPAAATAALRLLSFDPTDNRLPVGLTETTIFTITADDLSTTPTTDSTTTVIAASVNDPSDLSGINPLTTVNDNATATPFASLAITDPDPLQSLIITVTLDNASKGVFTPGSLSASGFTDAGGGTYTFTGHAGAAQAAIRLLAYDPTDNRVAVGATEITAFTISVNDGFGTISNSDTTVESVSVNDAPTIGGAVAGQSVDDTALVSPFSTVTIGDVDPGQSLTVSVTLDTAAKGVFTPASLVASGFSDSGGGVYTFTGSPAAATAAIRALVFDPADNRVPVGNTETTTFTISADDGIAPATTNSTTTVVSTSVNIAPVIGGTAAGQAVLDNATVQPFQAVTITDADGDSLAISVSIDTAAKGVFTPASLSASGFADAGGGSYTFSGDATAAQAAIRQLVFAPAENRVMVGSTETSTFTISVDDSIAPAITNTATTVVSTPFNDPTTITGIVTGQTVNDNVNISPFAGVTIADPDQPAQTINLFIVIDIYAKGEFTPASVAIGGFSDFNNGLYSRVGTAAQLTAAIRALVFNPTNDRVAVGLTETTTFTIVTSDNVASLSYNADTSVISMSVNDAPIISGTVAAQAVDDSALVSPFSAVTFTDPDPGQVQTVTVTLDDAAKGVFTPASLTASGFSNSGGGMYTFTGTALAATTAIRALVFDPANDRVTVGATETTTFTIAINDGIAATVSDTTTTVVSTSVNDAPIISGAVAGQAVLDNATVTPFGGITINDPDSPAQTQSVTVTLSDAAAGSFTPASLSASGFIDAGAGVYTFSGTAAAATTAIRQLVFAPTENRVVVGSTETTTFTISVNDGVASPATDPTTTVIASPFNDPTQITGSVAGQSINDTDTITPFAAITVSDPDVPAQTMTATVSLDAAAKGAFTDASLTASGFVAAGGGAYTFTGTAAAITTAIRLLVFRPTPNRVSVAATETTTLTLSVADGFAPAVSDSTTSIISTSVNDAPVITGAVSGQAVDDTATLSPFSSVTIVDPDPGQTLNISVALDDQTKGLFTPASLAASGFINAGGGVYTFAGIAAAATAAIRALVFNPTDNRVAAAATETTTFTITVDDGIAPAAVNSTTTVVSTNVNDAPQISGTVSGIEVLDNATVAPFTTVTFSDADPATTLAVSVTLSAPAQGVFTPASLAASGFSDAGGGTYEYTGTPAAATAAIRQLVFAPIENRVLIGLTETTTFMIAVHDGIAPAVVNSSTSVIVSPFNDPTEISGTQEGQAVLDTGTLLPFAAVTITDPDSPAQTLVVTITLDNSAKGGFTSASLAASGFGAVGGGVYSYSGTAAQATVAIRQLVFRPTANRVTPGLTETVGLTVTINDGVAAPVVDSGSSIISTSVNDAPTITGTAVVTVNDKSTAAAFPTIVITDADPGSTISVSVSVDSTAKGGFTSASLTASGFIDAGGGTFTFSGTPAQATAALRALVFAPVENRAAVGATEQTTLTVSVSDGIAPAVSDNASVVSSLSINDPVSLSGAAANLAVNDDATIRPFQTFTFADVDPGQNFVIRVSHSAANGRFTDESLAASGFSIESPGVYTFSGGVAAATTAIRLLAFSPTANADAPGQNRATTFTVSADDGSNIVSDNNTSVIATSINDAPSIAGASAQPAINDTQSASPFGDVTFTDPDLSAVVTVSVQLDDSAKGAFTPDSLAASGFADAGNGLYTFSGTPQAATTALRALVFVPTENRVTSGDSETVIFTLTITDGVAAPVADSNTSIQIQGVNDAPSVGSVSTSLDFVRTGQTFILAASGVTDTDGTISRVRYYHDSNGNGTFDGGDELLGEDTDGSDGWSFVATADPAWGVGIFTLFAQTVDNEGGLSSAASTFVTVAVNNGPLVATVTAVPGSATLNQRVTVTATGVNGMSRPVKKVYFYEDTNGNGVWDARDKKIGTDSKLADGFSASFILPKKWALGSRMLFARADVGGRGGIGDAAAVRFTVLPNTAPVIQAIIVSPTTIPTTNKVTLSSPTAADGDGSVKSVEYFVDRNFNGVFDAADRKVKSVSNARGGWSTTVSVNRAWINDGSVRFFARAIDNNKLAGAFVTLTVPVG